MAGINSGILRNAFPLSATQVKEVEKDVILNNKCIAYLDENNQICFAQPHDPEGIKRLAWHNAHQLLEQDSSFIKKVYTKTGLDTFILDKVLEKGNIEDSWRESSTSEEERLEGDGAEYFTFAPTALSFRSTAPLNELQEIQINGVTVDPSNYTLEEGSTIVTFPIDYLKTLNVGSYEVAVASNSKTVKGDFIVKAPELNEQGFYYSQPYGAYALNSEIIVIFRKNNLINVVDLLSHVTEICTYAIDGDTIVVSSSLGELHCTVSIDGIYCAELGATFELNCGGYISDGEYLYSPHSWKDGYFVTHVIDNTKTEYAPIRTGINGKPTVEVEARLFSSCSNLTTTPEFPNNIPVMNGFEGCSSLTSATIPDSITAIAGGTFRGCTTLTEVIIGKGVIEMDGSVFYDCTSLTNITFNGTSDQWNSIYKGVYWNYGVPATHVHCIDGDVAL